MCAVRPQRKTSAPPRRRGWAASQGWTRASAEKPASLWLEKQNHLVTDTAPSRCPDLAAAALPEPSRYLLRTSEKEASRRGVLHLSVCHRAAATHRLQNRTEKRDPATEAKGRPQDEKKTPAEQSERNLGHCMATRRGNDKQINKHTFPRVPVGGACGVLGVGPAALESRGFVRVRPSATRVQVA